MFKNIKLLRKLKRDSYEIEYSSESKINKDDEAVICINAKDKTDIISKYSVGSDLTINSELSDYLKENADEIQIKHPLSIKICSDKEFSTEDKSKVKLALRNHFTKKVSDVNEKLYENEVECWTMVFLSFLFLLGYVLLKIHLPIEILTEIVLIVAWVFVWRMTESIVFVRREMRREAIKYYRLLTARIEFN
ncbi:MAG: hypothetical protein J6Q58_00880 [Clostridia bacterium]|nr:hypothetical protein [Clostridia bacterium]